MLTKNRVLTEFAQGLKVNGIIIWHNGDSAETKTFNNTLVMTEQDQLVLPDLLKSAVIASDENVEETDRGFKLICQDDGVLVEVHIYHKIN
ncbi:hypothetical protein MKY59_21095 [Paenibacillus sp. FSL W8-0426]|uniref:hypothetical protein n=1 Tax=Paenibacillus sp. FSL W8-0426 TaxID=2921714 RepID=UPI0030DB7489